jgi:hypothetical protein
MAKPPLADIPEFYQAYVNAVEADDLVNALTRHVIETEDLLQSIPGDKWDHAYAPGKWTIKELVQHVMDSERVFVYRALRFSRLDPTPLPGFDENLFAENSNASTRNIDDMIAEFLLVRKSTLSMFRSFTPGQLNAHGVANDKAVSVEAIGFIIAGHMKHHQRIINERYL